jgi:hypothetical protein
MDGLYNFKNIPKKTPYLPKIKKKRKVNPQEVEYRIEM